MGKDHEVSAAGTSDVAQWSATIARQNTEADVIRVANDCLASLVLSDPDAVRDFPVSQVRSADELAELALAFVNHELLLRPESRAYRVVSELCRVLVAAQMRVREIRGREYILGPEYNIVLGRQAG